MESFDLESLQLIQYRVRSMEAMDDSILDEKLFENPDISKSSSDF
jgi:hypothetical protein